MRIPTWFVEGTDILAVSNNGDQPRGKLFLLACGVHHQNCAGKEQNKSSFTALHTPIGNKNNYSTKIKKIKNLTAVEYC